MSGHGRGFRAGYRDPLAFDTTEEEIAWAEERHAEEVEAAESLPLDGPFSQAAHRAYMDGWLEGRKRKILYG